MNEIKGMQLGLPQGGLLKFKNLACPSVESGDMVLSPSITEFKEQLLQSIGVTGVSLFGSSTSAHEVLFKYLKSKGFNNVIFQTNCFPSVCFAANRAGLRLRFVDVDLSGQMSLNSLENALDTQTTASIVHATSIGGCVPAHVDVLKRMVKGSDGVLVEDAAHSFGARRLFQVDGVAKMYYAGGWADFSVFSFSHTKPLTCGNGGAIVCNDPAVATRLEAEGMYGRMSPVGNGEFISDGWSSRFTSLNAALGLASLHVFWMMHGVRSKIAQKYNEAFKSLSWMHICDMAQGSWYKYPVVLKDRDVQEFVEYCKSKKIGMSSKIYDTDAPTVCRKLGMDTNDKTSLDWVNTHVCLPMHSWLTTEDTERVIDVVTHF